MKTYAVVITPRTGSQRFLPEPFRSFLLAQTAANVEAENPANVGVEIWQWVGGRWVPQWERNLWQERREA